MFRLRAPWLLLACFLLACGSSSGSRAADAGPAADAGARGDGGDDVTVDEPDAAPIPEPDCTALTCAELNASCGTIDDGCGNTLACGICQQGLCFQGQCTEGANCGDQDPNDCMSCVDLAQRPGDDCSCGGALTTCNFWRTVSCNDDNSELAPVALDATDSAVTTLASVTGELAAVQGDALDYDLDLYQVEVAHVQGEPLDPLIELELVADGPVDLRVSYAATTPPAAGEPLLLCLGEGQQHAARGQCSLSFAAGSTQSSIQLLLFYDGEVPSDQSGNWDLTIQQRAGAVGGSPGACDSYELRYRF